MFHCEHSEYIFLLFCDHQDTKYELYEMLIGVSGLIMRNETWCSWTNKKTLKNTKVSMRQQYT